MELVSDKTYKIVIKKRKNEDKKYFLNKTNDKNIIGILPFLWQKPVINDLNKEYFLSPSNLFLKNNKLDYIFFRDKEQDETIITYKKNIKRAIIDYFEETMRYDGLKMKNIINILDINSNKTQIYIIYLNSNKKIFNKIKKEYDNFKNMRLLLFFTNPELSNKELIKNIIELEYNSYMLNKMISLYEKDEKILDLRLKTIYEKILNN